MPTGARDTAGQQTTWFGGGKLAPDLSLPQLRARWQDGEATGPHSAAREADVGRALFRAGTSTGASPGPAGDLSDTDRRRLWVAAENAVRHADEHIRHGQ